MPFFKEKPKVPIVVEAIRLSGSFSLVDPVTGNTLAGSAGDYLVHDPATGRQYLAPSENFHAGFEAMSDGASLNLKQETPT